MSVTQFVPARELPAGGSFPDHLVYRDGLTGIANRRCFDQQVDEVLGDLERGEVAAAGLLFLDLDRFKPVNDTLGHAVGDALLCLVAKRLSSLIAPEMTLARLGGDEFAVLVPSCSGGDAQRDQLAGLAERILELVQRAYLIEGHVLHVGVSIGVSLAPENASRREDLLKYADLALYHSKAAGRGVTHFFNQAMEDRANQRREMEIELRKALPLRQLKLRFQPQVDVESGKILALEGFLHWQHPVRGLLKPAEFLPLAEEIGVSMAIGEWMLKKACKEAMGWPKETKVAVNISPLHFEAGKFAASVEAALEATGLPGSRLEIEVTEDVLLRDGPSVLETLEHLRSLGVRVAMDSFGTGFASLSQMVNFPFDKIKIDPSLTGSERTDTKSRAIIQAISALGHVMGIATLAEGVESSEQLAEVRGEQCPALRGFYYSEPLDVLELQPLFSGQK